MTWWSYDVMVVWSCGPVMWWSRDVTVLWSSRLRHQPVVGVDGAAPGEHRVGAHRLDRQRHPAAREHTEDSDRRHQGDADVDPEVIEVAEVDAGGEPRQRSATQRAGEDERDHASATHEVLSLSLTMRCCSATHEVLSLSLA